MKQQGVDTTTRKLEELRQRFGDAFASPALTRA